MADLVITEKDDLVSIANAIREKAGVEDSFAFPQGFLEALEEIGGDSMITASGTIIPAESQTGDSVLIDTGVVVTNNNTSYVLNNSIFCLWKNETANESTTTNGSYVFLFCQGTSSSHSYSYGIRPNGSVYNINSSVTNMKGDFKWNSGQTVKLSVKGNTTGNFTYGLVAGVEYGWAWIFKGELG